MYSKSQQVNYNDCDLKNRVRLSAMMRYMEQACSEQMAAINVPIEMLHEENLVFIITKTNIKVHRVPMSTDRLTVHTAPVGTRGVRFIREFAMDRDGERLISAHTLWVLADTRDHHVLRPRHFPYSMHLEESFLDGAAGDVPIPDGEAPLRSIRYTVEVRYSHLDVNNHVNNCMYADFVCDAVDPGQLTAREVDGLSLAFLSEARLGERISVTGDELPGMRWRVRGTVEGKPCFEALLSLK